MERYKIKQFITELIDISKKEYITIIVFIALVFSIKLGFMYLYERFDSEYIEPVVGLNTYPIDTSNKTYKDYNTYKYSNKTLQRFNPSPFDPNTATAKEMIDMGFNPRVANTIAKYTSKNGKFYKKEDLLKIYTIDKEFYQKIEKYIIIDKSQISVNNNYYVNSDKNSDFIKKDDKVFVDINKCTREDLQKIKGVGKYYANKIITFRDKLGGFYSISQVGETYNLPDSTFQSIKKHIFTSSPNIKKINVNKTTVQELKAHPYISEFMAKDIIANFPYNDKKDLLDLYSFKNKNNVEKIFIYLKFE